MTREDIHAIAFDAFGTLVTPVSRSGPYQRLAREAGVDPRQFRLDAMTTDIDVGELARRLGRGDLAAALIEEVEREASGVELFDDAVAVLSRLAAYGIPYVVCSNLGHGYGERVRQLTPAAVGHVFSYEAGVIKPDPMIYRHVLDILGTRPEGVLFVGDTPKADFDGPISVGMLAQVVERDAGRDLETILGPVLRNASPRHIVA